MREHTHTHTRRTRASRARCLLPPNVAHRNSRFSLPSGTRALANALHDRARSSPVFDDLISRTIFIRFVLRVRAFAAHLARDFASRRIFEMKTHTHKEMKKNTTTIMKQVCGDRVRECCVRTIYASQNRSCMLCALLSAHLTHCAILRARCLRSEACACKTHTYTLPVAQLPTTRVWCGTSQTHIRVGWGAYIKRL